MLTFTDADARMIGAARDDLRLLDMQFRQMLRRFEILTAGLHETQTRMEALWTRIQQQGGTSP